jgi:hypothetical protein
MWSKKYVYTLLSLLFTSILLSQSTSTVFITGNIKSAASKTHIEKVIVEVFQNASKIKSTVTGIDGNFKFEVPEGSYLLKFYKSGYDTAVKNNINLKDGEQVILGLYLREPSAKAALSCKGLIESGIEVYNSVCLINSKLIKDGLSPEQATSKFIKFPCVYQVRAIRFKIILDEQGKVLKSEAIEAIDNSNKHHLANENYPFWEQAVKEGLRILQLISFDAPKLKSNQQSVKTFTTIDVPISCK